MPVWCYDVSFLKRCSPESISCTLVGGRYIYSHCELHPPVAASMGGH